MEFKLAINCDNPAFDNASSEVARILRELADRIDGHPHFSAGHSQPVMDANGNEVGGFVIEADDPEDDEDDEDLSPRWTEPDEGDLVTSDYLWFHEHGMSRPRPVVVAGCSDGSKDWIKAVKGYMDSQNFWPNVWYQGERGEWNLLDLETGKFAKD